MTTGVASLIGHAPTVAIGPAPPMTEQRKYQRMWEREEYRQVAPGEHVAPLFLQVARPEPGSVVIDFGAGTGRGALSIALLGGLQVEMLDFAPNCLDPEVREALTTQSHALRFTQHDLTRKSPIAARYGYCTDVMEHIPADQVDQVLLNIIQAAQHVFFQISCEDDVCGKLIGHPLHLSIHDHAWWLAKLQALDCVVHWSQDFGSHCAFYVTGWQDAKSFVEHGVLNVAEQQLLDNIRANLAHGWQEVSPHVTNDFEVILLAGGPSLNDFEDDIRELRSGGAKLITTNGTYHWALERGLTPGAQIIVDAREFNKRFVQPVVDGCKYLLSSQVHPKVLEGLPEDRTLIWHTTLECARELVSENRPTWWGIPGGSTVILRAIPLMRLLGYRKFHIFGWDSCIKGDAHHAYAQPENDGQMIIPLTCGERVFYGTPWMGSQAAEFMDLVRFLGDEIDLEVYGDGLIAHILKTGASMADLEIPALA